MPYSQPLQGRVAPVDEQSRSRVRSGVSIDVYVERLNGEATWRAPRVLDRAGDLEGENHAVVLGADLEEGQVVASAREYALERIGVCAGAMVIAGRVDD